MIEVAIMIEGQNGLTWDHWQRIALAVEDLGFSGLYRSDHFTNSDPPDKASLEMWTSLTWLASHTQRIEFGPLVSPVSFRHPAMTARIAAAVDDLSNGRLILGLGAGWQDREHRNYGFNLLNISQRFDRFEEGLEVVTRLLRNDTPSDYSGDYFSMRDGLLLPRPLRRSGPPILIGGNGPKLTLPLAAKFADEWNAVYTSIPQFKELNRNLDELLENSKRQTASVCRSLMTGCVFGYDQADLTHKVAVRTGGKRSPQQLFDNDLPVGTSDQIVHQLGRWAEAGVQRIMLQWLDLEDINGLEGLAQGVLHKL